MLTIDRRQLDSLEAIAVENYENAMSAHLNSLAPEHTGAMGREALSRFITSARKRALSFGITQTDTTRVWLELSMLWGIGFPDDPQFSFARSILEQGSDELLRMRRLHREAREFLLLTNGEGLKHHRAALKRVASEDLSTRFVDEQPDDTSIVRKLEELWPEKYRAVGSTDMAELVALCRADAAARGLDVGAGSALLSVLALFMGRGCVEAPQYPWLARSLEHPGPEGVMRLYRRSRAYLRGVLTNGYLPNTA